MAGVDEEGGDGPRTGVEVLVAAPGSEVDAPVVEGEGDVAGGVGEVPADGEGEGAGVGGDAGDVKALAAVEVDAGEEDEGGLGGVGGEGGEDVVEREVVGGGVRGVDGDQCLRGKGVVGELGEDRVLYIQ